ncbi:alpha/beta fold hydrolase [Mucilaginibacter sp. SP1R1]|uniref:alpha/beta fold hydrolase n=1 Tax=Mucilaginibacter sp. SP1R1 TaxID=2723091 RepID=UPI00161D32E1|nr:alpha/beta hydrolase [Mucilaginibacter sp. SP1R1]MBB6147961.1 sigma-B regulation protein RsbQ [Mucilaginibacter sp. SP1R1]
MNSTIQKKNNVSIEGNLNATRTIVFTHGFGTDKTAWGWVKDDFKDDYRLVLFDNVGAGSSDQEAYNADKYKILHAYADDMLAILADLELYNAIIVAHSVSSMVTLLAAIKAPEYFSNLVFIGASPRYLNDDIEDYTGGFTQQALDGMYSVMAGNYCAWANGFSEVAMDNPDQPELAEHFAYTLSAIRPDIALEVASVIFESDIRKELSKLQKRVLLLHTIEDIAVPSYVADYLSQHIKGSTLKYLNAKGHFPHISNPRAVIAAIKSFI